jgi:hypothetical protein
VDLWDVPDRWNAHGPTDARAGAEKDQKERQDGETETVPSDDEVAQATVPLHVDEAEEQSVSAEASQQYSESGKRRPRCIACNEIVSSPCWYCTECSRMSAAKQIFFPASSANCLTR